MTDPTLYLSMFLGLGGFYVLISSFHDDDNDGERIFISSKLQTFIFNQLLFKFLIDIREFSWHINFYYLIIHRYIKED